MHWVVGGGKQECGSDIPVLSISLSLRVERIVLFFYFLFFSLFFSFFSSLSWVVKTQLNHWTKWVVGEHPINHLGPKRVFFLDNVVLLFFGSHRES